MKLINVCVGKTRQQDIRGYSVKTAYVKEPIVGSIAVENDGLANNEVAVHTDAIYAFSEENYSYWSEQLNVDSEKFPPGFFAENLIISQLEEKNLHVGDVIAIGKQVQLSVSGPRIPCFKLCWRLEQPDSFIQTFGLSGKSGVYFNVVQTGQIQAGDQVKVVHKEKNSITITEIAAIALGHQAVDEEKLAFILALPGLSETSALILTNRLYAVIDQKRVGKHGWKNWRKLEVEKIIEETPSIKSFILKPIDDKPLALYRAGQFLTVKLPVENKGASDLIRVWSLSDYQDQADAYRLSIKEEFKGLGSGFMHNQVQPGMHLEVQTPMGRFALDRSGFKPILLIAGGIGITPMLAMLKAHLSRAQKKPPIYFVHCCQNSIHQPFRDELDELANQYDIPMLHVYDQPNDEDVLGVNHDIKGYLTIQDIKHFIDGCHIIHGGKKIDMPLVEMDIYMCGPPVFQDILNKALVDGGANPERMFQESFQASSDNKEQSEIESSQVIFSTSNKEIEWQASDNLTLLELAESAGLAPANACRMGVCQSCSATLTEGSVYYDFSLTHEVEKSQVLLCRAKPKTKRVVIKL